MEANLYLLSESFMFNSHYSLSEIEDKTKSLAEDFEIINRHSGSNKLYVNFSSIYDTPFYSQYTIGDFLCTPQCLKEIVDRDVINAIQNIFKKTQDTTISSAEVIETLLPWHNDYVCHGLIAFHPVEGIPNEVQLVYGIESWRKFRRYFLGLYPNVDTFISECSIYFPNLFFHPRNEITVSKILSDFSTKIVFHLSVLNDVFAGYEARQFENESIKYSTLTIEGGLDEEAASKDNKDFKEKLTFQFTNNLNQEEDVSCYPHLRLCKSDKPGDSKYYFHRIYFHEGKTNISDGKILIAHIGEHL